MAVTIDTNTLTALGAVRAGAPSPGNRVSAQGRLVLAEDGETVLFEPADPAALEAVIAADEA